MLAILVRMVGFLTGIGLSVLADGQADAQQVRLTKLSDLTIGALSTTASDVVRGQNVCAYASSLSGAYSVRASGSGVGNALTLAGPGAPMPFEVQWSGTSGQTSGTALPANTTVGGFTSGLVTETCSVITTTNASLVVILRAGALSAATAGSYSGTLTLIIAAQ